MERTIDWDDFRLVRAIAAKRSLAGAATALLVNQSTVFRRLGALEERLGTRLFERHRTGYDPTPAGEEMVALAAEMAEQIVGFERRVGGRDLRPTGELRVTTNDTFLVDLLPPLLAGFRRTHPGITLDLVVSNSALNLSKRDADIAIRATEKPPETLVGRRIAEIRWAVYGPKSMEGGRPFDLVEARSFDWVGFGASMAAGKPAKWLGEHVGDERIVCRLDTVLGIAELAAAGIGLALAPCFIADATPGLARLADVEPDFGLGLWLLTHPDLKNTARVRAFLDFAGADLAKRKAALEGRL